MSVVFFSTSTLTLLRNSLALALCSWCMPGGGGLVPFRSSSLFLSLFPFQLVTSFSFALQTVEQCAFVSCSFNEVSMRGERCVWLEQATITLT